MHPAAKVKHCEDNIQGAKWMEILTEDFAFL